MTLTKILMIILIIFIVLAVVYIVTRLIKELSVRNAQSKVAKTLAESEKQYKEVIENARKEAEMIKVKAREAFELEKREKRKDLDQIEKNLIEKEKYLDSRDKRIQLKDQELSEKIEKAKTLRLKQEEVLKELLAHLEKVAELKKDEAEKILMENVEREMRQRAGKLIKDTEDKARKVANRKAKEIVLDAIHKTAVEQTIQSTTSVVALPDDEMKGRIIGREGRNIRAFEAATGVDVIIDDTPSGVVLSSFDPIRRESARLAMEALVADGRIHPTRVEEAIDKARKDLDSIIIEHGEKAADEIGLQFQPKLIELLGKLHFRTSFGQNALVHTLETARLAGLMALELGVNEKLAKRGAMLHDVGKAMDFEQEGSHDELGAEICRKYGESEEVINAILAHHEDEAPDTVEAVLVKVADAISSSRPGARKESIELYMKRLENLEKIASAFEGVEKVYAIQAGREVRVLVKPDEINDDSMHKLALDIANKIEAEVDYPGEVMISIVRETRATGIAK